MPGIYSAEDFRSVWCHAGEERLQYGEKEQSNCLALLACCIKVVKTESKVNVEILLILNGAHLKH